MTFSYNLVMDDKEKWLKSVLTAAVVADYDSVEVWVRELGAPESRSCKGISVDDKGFVAGGDFRVDFEEVERVTMKPYLLFGKEDQHFSVEVETQTGDEIEIYT